MKPRSQVPSHALHFVHDREFQWRSWLGDDNRAECRWLERRVARFVAHVSWPVPSSRRHEWHTQITAGKHERYSSYKQATLVKCTNLDEMFRCLRKVPAQQFGSNIADFLNLEHLSWYRVRLQSRWFLKFENTNDQAYIIKTKNIFNEPSNCVIR